MPHQDTDSASAGIRTNGDKPAGVVPRKTQQYIILGVAVLIVLISLFSSHGAKAANKGATAGAMPDPVAPNASEIAAYQQQLQNLQRAEQGGAPLPPGAMAADPATRAQAFAQQPGMAGPAPQDAPRYTDPPPLDPVKAEQQKRAYDSLFASNLALSYRAGENGADPPDPAPDPPAVNTTNGAMDAQIQQVLAAEGLAGKVEAAVSAAPAITPKPLAPRAPAQAPATNLEAPPVAVQAAPTGQTYVLQEGTIVPTVLLNRLIGDFSGPVECMVSNDVYSTDRQKVLIPSGSKLLGEAKQVAGFGQRRLAVMFHRLVLPDGRSFTLDNFQGLDQTGATGLHDQVNNHYFQIFGVATAIGILGAASELSESETTATGRALFLEGVGSGTSQASMQVLDKFLNVMPTITIREGHRVDIYLVSDLLLPAHGTPAASVQPGGGSQ